MYPPYDKIPQSEAAKAAEYLEEVGIDISSEHTQMTPWRLTHYLRHLLHDPEPIHLTTFKNVDPVVSHLVVVPAIPFWSACSHHLLPFVGTVNVGYIPERHLIGLSKITLLVRSLAKGFWMQEHLIKAIADNIEDLLLPLGLGVQICATHTCQLLDLKQPPIPVMKMTELRGILMHGPAARAEFYEMIR